MKHIHRKQVAERTFPDKGYTGWDGGDIPGKVDYGTRGGSVRTVEDLKRVWARLQREEEDA